jgi:hypothetical protein
MSAASFDVKRLTKESSLPASIAKLQHEFWGPLTGHSSAAEYERFLCEAARATELPGCSGSHARRHVSRIGQFARQ